MPLELCEGRINVRFWAPIAVLPCRSTAEEVREWLDTDASELRAAAEQIVATLDAAAAGVGTNLAKL